MRKGRIIQSIAAVAISAACALAPVQSAKAQRYSLEFKGGAAATSTFNSSCQSKTVKDSKTGVTVGAGFGINLPNDMIRLYGECYYTTKGEQYTLDNNQGEFSSDVCYFHLYPNARFYAPYIPVYVGAGLYIGCASSRGVESGDMDIMPADGKTINYYKSMDMGPRLAIGAELGVLKVRLILEGSYELGMMNISGRGERKIHNQCFCLSAGLCFLLDNGRYRHY